MEEHSAIARIGAAKYSLLGFANVRCDEEGCRPVDRQWVLEIVERAERRPQRRLLRTEEDLCVVAGEITEQLGELDFGMEDDDPKSNRLKLDYARLLANAVRDRIDPEPWARIQALIGALQGLEITFSQVHWHQRQHAHSS
jgi:uncharacterized alpha-E superfamily protein